MLCSCDQHYYWEGQIEKEIDAVESVNSGDVYYTGSSLNWFSPCWSFA